MAACVALAAARPEQYKEKEDFQYSRSSTDEGSKSGFYGAQRGNMGGNYEKAHNMDTLAQSQMSGLMTQVHGEIGEGANTRNGDVFGSANTRGVYGQGRHDLSNLSGRNFQDEYQGSSADSSSHSRYRGHSASASSQQAGGLSSSYASEDDRHSGRGSYGSINSLNTDESRSKYNTNYEDLAEKSAYSKGYHSQSEYNAQTEYERNRGRQQHRDGSYGIDSRRADSTHSQDSAESTRVNNNNEDFSQTSGHSKGYLSQSQYSAQEEYERSKAQQQHREDSYNSDADSRRRVTYYSPMRVVIRPGTRTNIPFTAQTVEDSKTSGVDENSIASDTKSNNNDHSSGKSKQYQSSFSYHKEWEKHDAKPTESRTSMASDRISNLDNNEDEHGRTRTHAFNSGYDSNNYQGQYERQSHGKTSSNYDRQQSHASSTHGNDEYQYNQNRRTASSFDENGQERSNAHLKSLVDQSKSTNPNRPKNYESSYSYHKSWERQGDPYVIIPESDTAHGAQTSERLIDTSSKHGTHSSYQRGSQQSKHSQAYYSSNNDDCDEDDHRRKVRSTNPRNPEFNSRESLGQETQSSWNNEDFGQQSQTELGNLEDFGQQNMHNNWANLEDLQQQSQNGWDNLGLQTQDSQKSLENLGQQTEGSWGNMEQNTQNGNIKFGQQPLGSWGNLDQYAQNENKKFSQQTQGSWGNLEQNTQDNSNFGEHKTFSNMDSLENLNQQSQNQWKLSGISKETEDVNAKDRQYTVVESYDNNNEHKQKPTLNIWDMIDEHDNNQNTRQNNTNKNATLIQDDKINDESDSNMRVIGITNSNIYKDQSEYNKQNQENQERDVQQEIMKPVWEQTAEHNNQDETQNANNNWNFNNSWRRHTSNEEHTFQESQNNSFYHRMQGSHIINGPYYPQNNKSNVYKENRNDFSQRNYDKTQNVGIDQDNNNSHIVSTGNRGIHENTRPISIANEDRGRGDIGFDDKPMTTKPDIISNTNMQPSLYKSPEEIETLSLTRKDDKKPNLSQNNGAISTSTQDNKHYSVVLDGERIENNGYNTQWETSNSGFNHRQSNDKQERTSETFNQENLDQQQFEDFGQQSENFDQQSQWEKLGQEVQGPWNPSDNLMKETQQTQELIDFEKSLRNEEQSNTFDRQQHQASRYSNLEGDQKQKDLLITQESEPLEVENLETKVKIDADSKTPLEVQTEKPGFWKSIGNKFTNAKDSVSSWFSSR